jgi:hypothetical protein
MFDFLVTREVLVQKYGIRDQNPAEDINDLNLPEDFIRAEKDEVVDMLKERNLSDEDT